MVWRFLTSSIHVQRSHKVIDVIHGSRKRRQIQLGGVRLRLMRLQIQVQMQIRVQGRRGMEKQKQQIDDKRREGNSLNGPATSFLNTVICDVTHCSVMHLFTVAHRSRSGGESDCDRESQRGSSAVKSACHQSVNGSFPSKNLSLNSIDRLPILSDRFSPTGPYIRARRAAKSLS
jgi:hypothetical protein